jgi:hypothetical protein
MTGIERNIRDSNANLNYCSDEVKCAKYQGHLIMSKKCSYKTRGVSGQMSIANWSYYMVVLGLACCIYHWSFLEKPFNNLDTVDILSNIMPLISPVFPCLSYDNAFVTTTTTTTFVCFCLHGVLNKLITQCERAVLPSLVSWKEAWGQFCPRIEENTSRPMVRILRSSCSTKKE